MTAKWERVADAIREQIRAGQGLRVDDKGVRWLPSYAELGEAHDVGYGTIRFALGILRSEGWIEGEQGVGVRVREDHPE